jgi:3-hydroxyacyl-CoA dehydrogenase/enoyl-CoA hydratase/3-hydroxybutyryl-CoA epimerase
MNHTFHYGDPVDGILAVRIERVDRPVNVLSRSALLELAALVNHVRSLPGLAGVLFSSGKSGNFIAGADVTELKDLRTPEAALEISGLGQRIFADLERLQVPTVALISGACLGGGLEFALACRYRIAADDRKTLLGLPEVKLGLVPGWGGTVRLPRLIGLPQALPMILAGGSLNGRQARNKGLVHDVVPPEALPAVGEQIVRTLAGARDRRAAEEALFRPKKQPRWRKTIERSGIVARYALKQAEAQTRDKTHGHYPAPLKAIELFRAGLGADEAEQYRLESAAVSELAAHPVTTECMRLFFVQEEAKKTPPGLSVAPQSDRLRQVAVVGAGAMGSGIALLAARQGLFVRMKDVGPEALAKGMSNCRRLVQQDVDRKRITPIEARFALDHLSPTTDDRGLLHADLVVEAVLEDLELKRKVFRELAEATGPETVLATNTSSLLVGDIARDMPHPERFVGLHFFNPPHQMPLVEVIRTPETSDAAVATALAFCSRIGKTRVLVGDCAGFLVNRLLLPYMNEAGFLLGEVDDPLEIDRAAVEFGMPMGPLELTDLVGIGVAAHVAENMHRAYGDRMEAAPLWRELRTLAADRTKPVRLVHERRGRKTFDPRILATVRKLTAANRGPRSARLSREEITHRLILPIVNEAARCLEERIALRPEDLDLAMVFGTGFAPFRGGPLRYAEHEGLDQLVAVLDRFAQHQPRLAPSPALRRFAELGQGFFVPIAEPDVTGRTRCANGTVGE